MKDVFRSGDSSKKFKIAEGQWYRYAPSYVSPAYHLLEGFPFIQEPPSGDLQERVLIRHHDYDQCFQSVQLLQWNSQDRKSGSAGMPRPRSTLFPYTTLFRSLVIRLRSLRLLRVSGIVMRLRMFLLLITFLKASHSFRNRLLVICKNAYLFATMIMTSVSSPFSCCSGIVRLNLM